MTSLTIYISRKLINYLDCYFTNKLTQVNTLITCDNCDTTFDKEIIYNFHHQSCPKCLSPFSCEFSEYDSNGTVIGSNNFNTNYTKR